MPLNNVDDLRQWLAGIKTAGSLSDDEVKALEGVLGKDKVLATLNDQVLMRADYTRKTQEVADQRKQLETDVNTLLQERADLATWRAGLEDKLTKAFRDLEAERTTRAQFESRIKSIAEQNGLDEKELLAGIVAPAAAATNNGGTPVQPTNGVQPANGQYLTQADVDKLLETKFSQLGILASGVPAELWDIAVEHQNLTGKPLSGAVEIWRTAVKEGKSLRAKWEEQYDIPKLRIEKERESIRAEERAKLDAEYKARVSENVLNGGAPRTGLQNGPKSVLFEREMKTPFEKETAAAAAATGDKVREAPPNTAARDESRWQRAAGHYLERRAHGVDMGKEEVAQK